MNTRNVAFEVNGLGMDMVRGVGSASRLRRRDSYLAPIGRPNPPARMVRMSFVIFF